jgi:hypothetical protein
MPDKNPGVPRRLGVFCALITEDQNFFQKKPSGLHNPSARLLQVSLVPSKSVVPPGGHHFVDHSTGVAVRIEGTSTEDVAKKLLEFRLGNQKAPGNPLKEVTEYVCGSWPHFCQEDEPVRALTIGHPEKPKTHISIRVMTWMASFVRFAQKDPGVHPSVAERRAMICANCSRNVSFQSGCGACQDNISRLAFVWKRDRSTASDKQLGACAVLGQHNGAAVWAEKLPPVESPEDLPANCWRRV